MPLTLTIFRLLDVNSRLPDAPIGWLHSTRALLPTTAAAKRKNERVSGRNNQQFDV
jgi:hypothetical protein